ncbi:helix-turn-helix transcriptional regulator (plasmid) [Shewanella khirikhana]|uniref:helix-turn-helix domain-containing protein n=1 Tax=Shewanella khirikhana TaxID=1965282 RepID=UPI0030D5FDBC
MFLLSESEAVKLAMKKSGLNQHDFAKKIGKSQAQISKYISGDSKPSTRTYIHCMNIITSSGPSDGSLLNLMHEVSMLDGEKHEHMRNALIATIKAYRSAY